MLSSSSEGRLLVYSARRLGGLLSQAVQREGDTGKSLILGAPVPVTTAAFT